MFRVPERRHENMEAVPGSDPVRGVISWGHLLLPFGHSRGSSRCFCWDQSSPRCLGEVQHSKPAPVCREPRALPTKPCQTAAGSPSCPPAHPRACSSDLSTCCPSEGPQTQLQPSALAWFNEEGAASPSFSWEWGKDWNPLSFTSGKSQEM